MDTGCGDWGQLTQLQDGHLMLSQPKPGEGNIHTSTVHANKKKVVQEQFCVLPALEC